MDAPPDTDDSHPDPPAPARADVPGAEVPDAVRDEERVLARVLESLRARTLDQTRRDYDEELIALRDELAEARLEDAPPLIAQMERLQAVASRRQEVVAGVLDARSPYFAHMRLKEGDRLRDVCLGRGTYLDPEHGVRVVDWRNAPVSRIYYRYAEGDPYEESFGDRDVEGEVLVRRDVTILDGKLMRIGGADATYVRGKGGWRTLAVRATRLSGGQGTAVLPKDSGFEHAAKRRGVLGEGHGEEGIGRRDRFLPEIAALLDPRQFETISRPAAGVVVIQGGAGSGKTTIGLHRIAYLAFQAPKRFTPERVIVLVPSRALAAYTSRVLPALDVPDVPVATLSEWQRQARLRALPTLPRRVTDETPLAAVKLKKHPSLLALLDRNVKALVDQVDAELRRVCAKAAGPLVGPPVVAAWELLRPSPLASRVAGVRRWLQRTLELPGLPPPPPAGPARTHVDHLLARLWKRARDVVSVWADLLTDRTELESLVGVEASRGLAPLSSADVEEAHRWCTRRCEAVLGALGQSSEGADDRAQGRGAAERADGDEDEQRGNVGGREGAKQLSLGLDDLGDAEPLETAAGKSRRSRATLDDETRAAYLDDDELEEVERRREAIDGQPIDEEESLGSALDAEDDAIFLRLHQLLRGPLRGRGKSPLLYEHVFVDEVQDAAAIDLKVLVECTDVVAGERSMTLAGDVAQRLTLDIGLGEFAPALESLGLPHVEVEPLQIGYRSTRQVLELAREVLGPLAPPIPPVATRDGAPVERHSFGDPGAAAAFLASALRDLSMREPLSSVALVTRFPWQADVYADVLERAEIPNLRRVRDQDFPFRAGVDLTDVKQVKGLEWDYVVLLDVNLLSYPVEDEARHLLHIAITRAAHQLWLIATGEPSPLVSGWD